MSGDVSDDVPEEEAKLFGARLLACCNILQLWVDGHDEMLLSERIETRE
jgi:hypothetical protein